MTFQMAPLPESPSFCSCVEVAEGTAYRRKVQRARNQTSITDECFRIRRAGVVSEKSSDAVLPHIMALLQPSSKKSICRRFSEELPLFTSKEPTFRMK